MTVVYTAPEVVPWDEIVRPSLFLAGSIEMGKAADWQTQACQAFSDLDATLLNPRRPDWDSSWRQEIDCAPFREQVEWELDGLEACDKIFMYFDPETKSPITICELGLHARQNKVRICCPKGFWRRGNIEIIAHRWQIPFDNELSASLDTMYRELESFKDQSR